MSLKNIDVIVAIHVFLDPHKVRWHAGALSLHCSPQVYIVLGGRRYWTSCSWPMILGHAPLVPLDCSARCTLVAATLTTYLCPGHTTIAQGKNICPFCHGQVLRCAHPRRNTDIALTVSVDIYRLLADYPNAMSEVWGWIVTFTKPN